MSAKAIFGALEMLFSRHRRFLNRVADKGLRALGPMLVTFAIGLLGTVTIFYFVFVVRLRYFFALGPDGTPLVPDYSRGGMPLPEMTPGRTVGLLLDLAVAVWICACMWFNFYMAIMAKSYVPMHRQEALADMLMSDLSAPAPEDLGPAEGSLGDNPAEPFLQAGRRAGPGSRDHCRRCDQARPPRSHHCSICDRCVHRMDHHCPWIATCVGANNHRYFVLFLAYLTLACAYFSYKCLPFILSHYFDRPYHGFDPAIFSSPWTSFFLNLSFFLALIIFFPTLALLFWNLYLASMGKSQLEYHGNWRIGMTDLMAVAPNSPDTVDPCEENPFDVGFFNNLRVFFRLTSRRRYLELLLPVPVPPLDYGEGWSYPNRRNFQQKLDEAQ
ncbi:hypothetical protein H696_04238 [Fonticula alba]|uniref:Palmitoyltransferase n=1 Tax=Fonticula alba TaxID=691883 RepID=A0A058Z3V6_FONAL|nr:hypothetical protein H696_04238 [Fonticula alba]KCV68821.1 hypothetical protein H696_04238 [Fonticula alba]|eukprot:XP_009496392.1 hypothetical protein H696_04238 [Fonticula alba]